MKTKLLSASLIVAPAIAAGALFGANQAFAEEEPRYCPFDILITHHDSSTKPFIPADDPCGDPLW